MDCLAVHFLFMNIHFHSVDIFDDNGAAAGTTFLKSWYDWKGTVPMKDDIILLHWGPNNEETDPWRVYGRQIDGTKENVLNVFLTKV